MTFKNFIKKRRYLVWHVKDPENLSPEAIVEAVLNYGNWDDVQTLIKIIGIKKTARIFRKQMRGWRTNYYPQIQHYFKLYFNKYVNGRSTQK